MYTFGITLIIFFIISIDWTLKDILAELKKQNDKTPEKGG